MTRSPSARMHRRGVAIFVAVVCVAIGCGRRTPFPLSPISGRVTLDGEPLAGGVVVFQPLSVDEQSPGPGSTGRCDDQGRYELRTIGGAPGAVVATHKVRIYSQSSDRPVAEDVDVAPQVERVPDRYNYRSNLTLQVSAAGTSDADFKLTTKQ